MKFGDVSKDAQVVLLGCAMAGVIETFGRDADDEGRRLLETALQQVGLTPDEFKKLVTELEPEVEKEVEAVMNAGDDNEMYEADELDTMEERPGNLNDAPNINADGWENLKDE